MPGKAKNTRAVKAKGKAVAKGAKNQRTGAPSNILNPRNLLPEQATNTITLAKLIENGKALNNLGVPKA